MKHRRVSNRRIKQILGEILYEDMHTESHNSDNDQTLVEKKKQSNRDMNPGLDIDSENK
ncbi:hypothetical protein [Photobacterium alginatilyticum]|nr:hypothetical protein [Photobacterium alginatilyticum]